MSNLIEHAKREFKKLGYKPVEECTEEDGPNKWIQENVLELLETFSKQGHSGSSAPYCIEYFKILASFKPIAPITAEDDEWNEIGEESYQNNRCSAVFKDGKSGEPYYLDAIIWKTQNGGSFSGTATDSKGKVIKSRQFIILPFMPKTFHIQVIETEVTKDNWKFTIKNDEDLKEVFTYYKIAP